jgi:hypothetical protein
VGLYSSFNWDKEISESYLVAWRFAAGESVSIISTTCKCGYVEQRNLYMQKKQKPIHILQFSVERRFQEKRKDPKGHAGYCDAGVDRFEMVFCIPAVQTEIVPRCEFSRAKELQEQQALQRHHTERKFCRHG